MIKETDKTQTPLVDFGEPVDMSKNIIKVVGVGGGGCNAVNNMYRSRINNVTFAVCNTDSQSLANSPVPVKLLLGSAGLGAGANPEIGRKEAEENLEGIKKLFNDGTRMVFVTAGMGGGTGTGAAPVVAGVAKSLGLLTVGIVTIPFYFEKKMKIVKALKGVEEMRKNVDALLVINNERLCDIYADGMTTVEQAFSKADDILTVAAKSISEIITTEGIVNRDFCDVQTVMKDGGDAIMSVGRASGEHRIEKAFVEALNSPLLNNMEIERARRLLYIIYTCDESQVTMSELSEINCFMDDLAPNIEVLWGLYRDNSLGEDVKVTLIATDFEKGEKTENSPQKEDKDRQLKDALYAAYYGDRIHRKNKSEVKEEAVVQEDVEESPLTKDAQEPETSVEMPEVVQEERVESPALSGNTKKSFVQKFLDKLDRLMEE